MPQEGFSPQHRILGITAAWAVCVLSVVYAVVTGLGFLSLNLPTDPIGDPYFSLMELLMILMAALMVVSMVAVHAYASKDRKCYASVALIFIILMAVITSSVHFVILAVSRPLEASGMDWVSFFLSFKWPSIGYALDILAWDWFFALSMLFCAPVFRFSRLENAVRILMLVSGILSLLGLVGMPLANMQVRNIGILGYGVVAPVIFLLLGFVFGRTRPVWKNYENQS